MTGSRAGVGDGALMYALMKRLHPLCRSITGDGVRKTLQIIRETIPIEIHEVATGEKAFDWIIPREWNIRDAYIKNSRGEVVVDFKGSNLHVVGYSIPVSGQMGLEELKQHIYTDPNRPKQIPYITSYYKDKWGFCMEHERYVRLKNDTYEVRIDSSLKDGHLTYGELYIGGALKKEVLFSCYVCHPSLCNDNLSGIVLLTRLAEYIRSEKRKHSYRFLFIPETIGSIAWLSRNGARVKNVAHGLIATCVGDSGNFTYKKSRRGDAEIDRIVERVLIDSGEPHFVVGYNPADGGDERQFCSPAFNMPVGSLMRSQYGKFPEYHSSADNLEYVSAENLEASLKKYKDVVHIIENDEVYVNKNPRCEPHLGKRGLYRNISDGKMSVDEASIFWVLSYSDGCNSLLDISYRSGIEFRKILAAANVLREIGLLDMTGRESCS